MAQSKKFDLSRTDVDKWQHNVISFLAPLGVIYLGAIIIVLQTPGHVFQPGDFIPSNFTAGAMALYVVNALFDLSRKYVGGKK